MAETETRTHVFISYCSEDRPWLQELQSRLATLEEGGRIELFDDTEIPPGAEWREAIEAALSRARAAVCLISPAFLESDFIVNLELPNLLRRARDHGVTILPVIVAPTEGYRASELGRFQAVNRLDESLESLRDDDAARARIWDRLAAALLALAQPVTETTRAPRAAGDPDDERQLAACVERLAGDLRANRSLVFFVGSAAVRHADGRPPRPTAISRALLEDLAEDDEHPDLEPLLDVVGQLYALRLDEDALESMVHKEMARHFADVDSLPAIHLRLAELLAHLRGRRHGERASIAAPILIVTTNFDLFLERAFLAAGLPFTRLVHHRDARTIDVNEYREVATAADHEVTIGGGEDAVTVYLDDAVDLRSKLPRCGHRRFVAGGEPGLRDLPLSTFTPPYLYKLHGSEDADDSCAISCEQHLAFLTRVLRHDAIPREVRALVAGSLVLFLGYDFLDADFRIASQLFFGDERGAEPPVYAARMAPDRDPSGRFLEPLLWPSLRRKSRRRWRIDPVLAAAGEEVLRRVDQALAPAG